jgi:hypothetical protein
MGKQVKLSADYNDLGDEITRKPIYIYHVVGVKVGSSTNYQRRVKEQGYDLEDVEILMQVIPHCTSCNHVWFIEQIEALKLGYSPEHNGQRQAVNRLRSSKRLRSYVLTSTETGEETVITDAAAFELQHKLARCSVSRVANPKNRSKFLYLDGVQHSVAYADIE